MLAVVTFGFGGEARADNECGTVSNGAAACNGASYSSGIRYRNHDGLDLTVGASGAVEIQSRTNANGVHMETRTSSHTGAYTLRVHGQTRILQNAAGNGSTGIFVRQGGTGSASVQVDSGAQLGTATARWGERGINVFYDQASSELLNIINNGNIFSDGASVRNAAGIAASRNSGSGRIKITSGGLIDSRNLGIYAYHGGEGAIEIDNRGSINVAGSSRSDGNRGITARQAGAGGIDIRHSGSIVSEGWGIFARKDGTGGGINIQSSGNIETTGADMHGILVDVRSAATATDPVAVKITDGTIKATGSGVSVNQRTQGAVTIELLGDGSIGTRDSRTGAFGIIASINNRNNNQLLSINSAGKIFANSIGISGSHIGTGKLEITHSGHIDSMNHRGIRASHGGSGAIQVTTHRGSMISSALEGIHAQHTGSGDIRVTHAGEINSKDGGIRDGIHVRQLGTGAVEVTHEGRIDSTGHGIFARRDGSAAQGGITINSRGDITATRGWRRAGINAQNWGPKANGDITVNHEGGTIESHNGIVISYLRSGSSTSTVEPAADYAPEGTTPDRLVVNLTGGQIIARSAEYDPSIDRASSEHQVGWKTNSLIFSRFEGPRGVAVGTFDAQRVGQYIAAGDRDSTEITDEVRTQFRAVLEAARLFEGSPGSEFAFGNLLDPRNLVRSSFSDDLPEDFSTDNALDEYLEANDRELLSRFLEYTLSSKEVAVIEALFTGGDIDAALAALPTSYTEAYKNRVRWFAESHNEADIEINVGEGYRIVSGGDGIRAGHRAVHDNSGAIAVTVRKGASVTAERYGIWVANAGLAGRDTPDQADDIRDQTVTVEGEVRSTGTDGVGVYMEGGGRLVVGPAGRVVAASGVAVQAVRDPMYNNAAEPQLHLTLALDGRPMAEVLGGRVVNNDGKTRIVVDGVLVYDDAADGATGRWSVNGLWDVSARKGNRGVSLLEAYAPRAMLYETLPGLLLRLDGGAPTRRPEDPAWAQVEYGTGKGKADRSSTGTDYDHDRIEAAAGISRELGEDVSGSLWLRRVQAEAELDAASGEGELDLRGWGAGVALRWRGPDGWEASGQVAYTDYDVDASSWRGALARDIGAEALSVDLEAKYGEFRAGGVALRPRAWARHTQVEVDDFTDTLGVRAQFSDESRTSAGLGLRAEMEVSEHLLYGTVDVEHLLGGEETAVMVSRERLESESERTQAWVGFGGERRGTWMTLRGGMHLGDPGGENQEWVASLSLSGQF